MENYSRNMNELKCRNCGKWYITKKYFRKVKDATGFAPNCICQSGTGDIGGDWVEIDEITLMNYESARSEAFGELP